MRAWLILVLIGMGVIAGVAPTGDPDVWWHLKVGELALTSPARLTTDPFSYSQAGVPWRYHDLAADVVLYVGYTALGFAWFSMLKVLATFAIGVAFHVTQRRGHRGASATVLATALVLLATPLVERPNLFTVAAFPLMLAFLERARRVLHRPNSRMVYGRLVAPVVLGWTWICLHRAGALAIALLAIFASWTGVRAALGERSGLGPRPTRAGLWGSAGAAVVLAALATINPSGLATLRTSIDVAGSAALRSAISEWQRLPPLQLLHAFPLPLGLATVALTATMVSLAQSATGDVSPLHAVLLVLFGTLSLDSVRWIPYLTATSVWVLLIALGPGVAALARRPELRLASLLIVVGSGAALLRARAAPFELGPDTSRTAVGAAAFLRNEGLGGRVANTLEHGGYLIWSCWPDAKVFVDGRNDVVYPPPFLLRAIESDHDPRVFAAMRREDAASIVVAGNAPTRLTHSFLTEDPAWALVYWSDPATVWVRVADHPALARRRYRWLDPRSLDASVVRRFADPTHTFTQIDELGAELERTLAASPESVRALTATAIYHHLRGDSAARERVLQRLDQVAPDHPAVVELRKRMR